MNASTTRSLTDALSQLQAMYPDWRYGQLVANVASWAGKDRPVDVWEVDDEQLLAAAVDHLRDKRTAVAAGESRKAV